MWKHVVAPVILVALFWGVSNVASTWYIRSLEQSQSAMVAEQLTTIRAAGAMRYDMRRMERLASRQAPPMDAAEVAEWDRLEHEFERDLDDAIATSLTEPEMALSREIRKSFEQYRQQARLQMGQAAGPPGSAAAAAAAATPRPDLAAIAAARTQLADQVSDVARRLGEVNEQLIQDAAAQGSRIASTVLTIRYSLLIIGPAAGLLCGYWISRWFNRSISQLSITLDDAAIGLRQEVGRVDLRRRSDLPRLQEQVKLVVARIREVTRELHDARQRAISAARLAAVGEMAAGVAHEIRNPLTSVKLLIQSAGQRADRAMGEKQFRVVLEEISRMETTIERLLDFARPARPNRARCDLRDIVSHSLSLIEGRAQHAGVRLGSELPQAPLPVDADAEQLGEVFSNLLQNGIEAMPGGGRLSITVGTPAGRPGRCRVIVADSGPGISAVLLDRIFEPFVTDKPRGTGLGLAICQRIIRDHDGALTAANRPEGGAVFTVELPRADASARGSAAAASAQSGVRRLLNPSSPLSVIPLEPAEDARAQAAGHR